MTDRAIDVHWTFPDASTRLVGRLATFGQADFQRFTYDRSWLAGPKFPIGEDLPLGTGAVAPPGGATEFGTFLDAAPDLWGRRVLTASIQPTPRTGTDFLLRVSDLTRQGALRFAGSDGNFVAPGGVPEPVTAIDELLHEVELFQSGAPEADGHIIRLLRAGSSQGGARPKAAVVDDEGTLWIAKFPSEEDAYDVETAEAAALEAARQAGLPVPRFRHIRVNADRAILLVARFDRNPDGGRLGYQSMRTAMRLGDNEPYDYQQMAATAGYLSGDGGRRAVVAAAALNIAVNNIDDHSRNIGFLNGGNGRWQVAPLFDVVPRPLHGSMPTPLKLGSERSLAQLLDLDWGLPRIEVDEIVDRVARRAALVYRIARDQFGMDPEAAHNGEQFLRRVVPAPERRNVTPAAAAREPGPPEPGTCGAPTKKGGRCRRKGHCPYHSDS